jgi:hypothetical protein
MSSSERISARMGNKILGTGTHELKIIGFVAREDDTAISELTVNDEELEDLTDFWPESTTFKAGELFMFSDSLEVTSITIDAGSVTAIRG